MTLKELLKKEEFSIDDFLIITKESIIKSKKLLLFIFSFFFIISIVTYSFEEVMYESKATVLINQSTASKSNTGLGTLLGINSIDISKNNIFGPEMYKDIIQSKAFLNNLVESVMPIDKSGKNKVSVEEYLLSAKKTTNIQKFFYKEDIDRVTNIKSLNLFNPNDSSDFVKNKLTPELVFSNKVPPIVELNSTRDESINLIKNKIKIENKGNTTSVTVQMNNAFVSAVLSKLVLERLIDFITLYKTTKEIDNIKYLEERLGESEEEYKNALMKFASYKDQSYGVIFQSSQTKEQFYSNEISLKFNLYNQFKTQLEQAKIDLKKEAPLFTVLDPISIPTESSNQNYLLYSIKYFALALVFSLILLLYKLFSNN
jgi:uncharacterized protein involved in exopolysaccharide biosynthesis